MLERHIADYHFIADPTTGMTMRWGTTIKDNPTWAPVPELADISISNHCSKGCSFCYKDSCINNEFLSVEDYCRILDSMNHPQYGNVFQVALGGGEPLEHPDFLEIIAETCRRSIVPNFTTNGMQLTPKICGSLSGKIGAVALSVSSMADLEKKKLAFLIDAEIKTNIHYVLSKNNLEEACKILRGCYNELLNGINAIVFLTYKPAGRANAKDVIQDNKFFRAFLSLVDETSIARPRFGFDACFVPMLLKFSHINPSFIDTCEGAFFSVYIDYKMNVSPCSFSAGKDSYSLKDFAFYDIWNHKFNSYRTKWKSNCSVDCMHKSLCHGNCPYYPQITICHE